MPFAYQQCIINQYRMSVQDLLIHASAIPIAGIVSCLFPGIWKWKMSGITEYRETDVQKWIPHTFLLATKCN